MKIPKTINICGIDYLVIWKPENEMRNEIGEMRYNEGEIWLNSKYKSTERINQVFIHECIHAVAMENNLEWDENTVNTAGVGVYPLLRQLCSKS